MIKQLSLSEKNLLKENYKNSVCREDKWILFKMFLLILFLTVFGFLHGKSECSSRHIPDQIVLHIEGEIYSIPISTWICKNPDCGYDNMEGIIYCPLCGKSKWD